MSNVYLTELTRKLKASEKKKLQSWLRLQAKSYKNRYFIIGTEYTRSIDRIDGVHLSSSKYIAEQLGLKYEVKEFDETKYELSFMFDDVKFYGLYEKEDINVRED